MMNAGKKTANRQENAEKGEQNMKSKTLEKTLITLGVLGILGGAGDMTYQATQGYKAYEQYVISEHQDQEALNKYHNEVEEGKRGLGVTGGALLLGGLGLYMRNSRKKEEEDYERSQTRDLILKRLKQYK